MSDKILTVIVPSYNMEKYLSRCLESLVVEPCLMERLEVIVVNDGSKDRTSEVAHQFASTYPQTFKVLDKSNGHYGSCVNAGLRLASGRFVRVLDADDYVNVETWGAYLVWLDSVNADLVLNDYARVDDKGNVVSCCRLKTPTDIRTNINSVPDSVDLHSITYRMTVFEGLGYIQSEGISYTDTEWRIIPMMNVATVQRSNLVVVNYFVGRPGQSMELNQLAKSYEQMLTTALAATKKIIIARGGWICEEESYVHREVLNQLQECYQTLSIGVYGHKVRADASSFDESIKRLSMSLYKELAGKARVMGISMVSVVRGGWLVRKLIGGLLALGVRLKQRQ